LRLSSGKARGIETVVTRFEQKTEMTRLKRIGGRIWWEAGRMMYCCCLKKQKKSVCQRLDRRFVPSSPKTWIGLKMRH